MKPETKAVHKALLGLDKKEQAEVILSALGLSKTCEVSVPPKVVETFGQKLVFSTSGWSLAVLVGFVFSGLYEVFSDAVAGLPPLVKKGEPTPEELASREAKLKVVKTRLEVGQFKNCGSRRAAVGDLTKQIRLSVQRWLAKGHKAAELGSTADGKPLWIGSRFNTSTEEALEAGEEGLPPILLHFHKQAELALAQDVDFAVEPPKVDV